MGHLMVGKWKDKNIKFIYWKEKAKAKPQINTTKHKKLPLGDV